MARTNGVTLTSVLSSKASILLHGSIKNPAKPLSVSMEMPDTLRPDTLIHFLGQNNNCL